MTIEQLLQGLHTKAQHTAAGQPKTIDTNQRNKKKS